MAKKKELDKIETVFVEDVMKTDYLEYALSVIKSRSIPLLVDGLKPVQRRILWAMRNADSYSKSARHVGEVLGKYHPHGECLQADTLMYGADGSKVSIKELYDNNVEEFEVLVYDEIEEKFVKAIAHSFRIGQYTDRKYRIFFGSEYVECTSNHPFLSYFDQWVKAENLKVGDLIIGYNRNYNITQIDIVETVQEPMYDFTVDKYENALIQISDDIQIVVHNSSVYDTMVRMAQDWKMYVPLVDGHGNFGSIDGDSAAAMRYCVTGDTIIDTVDYGFITIGKLAEGMEPNSDRVIDISVVSAFGKINKADRVFHSGKHLIYKMTLDNGTTLRGTVNHPVAIREDEHRNIWKVLGDIRKGDKVLTQTLGECDIALVTDIECTGIEEDVFSIRVCSECHSFITNGIISHNTEARLERSAKDLYFTYNQLGIEYAPNYDNKEKEPEFLSCPLPMVLVNGSYGTAVGFATSIPAHNPKEVASAYLAFIDGKLTNKNITKYLKGPDNPYPCKIIDKGGIERAYQTGKGSYYCVMDYHLEDASYGRTNIVFDTVLPMTDKTDIINKMVQLVRGEKFGLHNLISDIRDESSQGDIRIIVTTKKGANVDTLLEKLVEAKVIYDRFNISMVVIVNDCPRVLGIMDLFTEFHKLQRKISENHLSNTKGKLLSKLELLDGIVVAIKNYDKVASLIKNSKSKEDARDKIKKAFKGLNDNQVNAILETKLINLINKGDAIITEQKEIKAQIKNIDETLKDIDTYIKNNINELLLSLKPYNRRRSTIIKEESNGSK